MTIVTSPQTTKEFQVDLVKDLIGNYNSRERLGHPSTTSSVKNFLPTSLPQYMELREFIIVTTSVVNFFTCKSEHCAKNLILFDFNIQLSEYISDHAKSYSVQCLFITH